MESLAATPVGRLEEVKQCRKNIKKIKHHILFLWIGALFLCQKIRQFIYFLKCLGCPLSILKGNTGLKGSDFPTLGFIVIVILLWVSAAHIGKCTSLERVFLPTQ